MPIIKTKVINDSKDKFIKIRFSANDGFYGFQQEIDNLTEITSDDLINPVEDGEMRRFKIEYDTQLNFFFYWGFAGNVYYVNSFFGGADFTMDEINKSLSFFNSFFILDVYNTFDPNTQTKIATTYLTKLGAAPKYDINSIDSQFQYVYIPESYINKDNDQFLTAYIKFSFYNAKTGKIDLFYDNAKASDTTPDKDYFQISLNLENRTWKISEGIQPYSIYGYPDGNAYTNKVNDTFDTFDNKKQIYPQGETFETDGTYST